MPDSHKPVRKCHACLLNRGDHCWIYLYPRGQWRHHRHCPAFENETLYDAFRTWQKQPTIKKRKELRQAFFRGRRKALPERCKPPQRSA